MKIKAIEYNWHDNFDCPIPRFEVGVDDVVSITGRSPRVDGDRWNYMVKFKDGSAERVFNINRVEYFGEKEKQD